MIVDDQEVVLDQEVVTEEFVVEGEVDYTQGIHLVDR